MKRILIVDDEEAMRLFFKIKLKKEGYEVELASSGSEGISSYRERPADLVVTDIFMEDKDGIEMITELSEEFPNIKVIAISASGQSLLHNYLDKAKELGAVHVFSKPVDWKEFMKVIHNTIG